MAQVKSFSKKEVIRFGWETTKKNFWFLVGLTLVTGGIQFIPNLLRPTLREDEAISGILGIVLYVVSLGLGLGAIKIYLAFVDNKKPQFSDLFSLFKARLMWRYFLASILYVLSVLVSLLPITLLLLGSGQLSRMNQSSPFSPIVILSAGIAVFLIIYISTRFSFYTYFIVDKNMGTVESLASSWRTTKDHVGNLVLLGLLLGLITLAGVLALLVGLFVALPLTSLAMAYVYRKLSSSSKTE